MKKLLVGSVYAPGERNQTWYALQHRFLNETMEGDFTHVVVPQRVSQSEFSKSQIVLSKYSSGNEHADGLNTLIEHFANDRDHEHYLILDSDAFPFTKVWLPRLLQAMKATDRLPRRSWASAVRCENLDTFPHPCALFIDGELFRNLPDPRDVFDFTPKACKNLLGFKLADVGSGLPTTDSHGHATWLPLVRTNYANVHPILSAIYGGFFYHHGAGSRNVDFRSVALGYYDTQWSKLDHHNVDRSLFAEISLNPAVFLGNLTGEKF